MKTILTYNRTRQLFTKSEFKPFVHKYFKDVEYLGADGLQLSRHAKKQKNMRQTALTFKQKSLADRKTSFIKAIYAVNLERLILDETEIELFILHWAAVNPGGSKMHKDKFKTWEAVGRLRTWEIKTRSKKKRDPNLLDYWDPYFDKKLASPQLQMNYRKHLKSLGYIITHSSTAGESIKPPIK